MNFCVAILILKIEENKQHFWHVILYHFKKGKKNTTKTQIRFVQYMEKVAVIDRMYQKWLAKFCAGDFSLNDSPWLGRLVEVIAIKSRH